MATSPEVRHPATWLRRIAPAWPPWPQKQPTCRFLQPHFSAAASTAHSPAVSALLAAGAGNKVRLRHNGGASSRCRPACQPGKFRGTAAGDAGNTVGGQPYSRRTLVFWEVSTFYRISISEHLHPESYQLVHPTKRGAVGAGAWDTQRPTYSGFIGFCAYGITSRLAPIQSCASHAALYSSGSLGDA